MAHVGEERTYHWGAEPTPNQRRVPVPEAAELLGISEGAVRMRVKRGTLPSTRESTTEQPGRVAASAVRRGSSDQQVPSERPWWRRMFGG
jgi:hypothetical protein